MGNALDLDLQQASSDRQLLERIVRSIQLDGGGSYVDALDALQVGAGLARSQGSASLRTVLGCARVDCDYVLASLQLLEQLEAAVKTAHADATRRLARERVDGLGRVRLDTATATEAPTGADQQDRRLARARRAAPGQFEGSLGRARFLELDHHHLAAGLDVVRTLERAGEIRAMKSHGAAVGRAFDHAMGCDPCKHERLKRLEAEVAELRGVVSISQARRAAPRRTRRQAKTIAA